MKSGNKLRPFYVARILLDQTDETHFLGTNEIISILVRDYGLTAYRTSIAEDIRVLKEIGMDIKSYRSGQMKYHVVSRPFDDAELKLLINAVESSKFISENRSSELVEKLQNQSSTFSRDRLKRSFRPLTRFKPENENIFLIADAVSNAISEKKKISFQYYRYNTQKEKALKHNGKPYVFSPYYLIWDGDCYYMIGFSEHHGHVACFRVDRVYNIPLQLEDDAIPQPENFDIDQFMKSTFRMFDSERENVSLICSNDTIDAILEHYGMDILIENRSDQSFQIKVDTVVNHIFFAWVFGFGGKVLISSPSNVIEEYKNYINQAQKAQNELTITC